MTSAAERRILDEMQGNGSVEDRDIERQIIEGLRATRNGGRTAAEAREAAEQISFMAGGHDATDDYHRRKVLESFGIKHEREATDGELPLKARPFEATYIYAAKDAVEMAVQGLVGTIRHRTPSKDDFTAEAEADAIREQAYAFAARFSEHEGERLQAVADALATEAAVAKARAEEVSMLRVHDKVKESLMPTTEQESPKLTNSLARAIKESR